MKLETSIRDRLGKLPTDLRKLYQESLDQKFMLYEELEKSLTEVTLRLLQCLQKSLPTNDFVLALSCSVDRQVQLSAENVLDLCSDFLIIDAELDVFRFAHLSVREFLEDLEGYDSERNNALTAQCCLRYLSTSTVLDMTTMLPTRKDFLNDFHEYACLYWPFHLHGSRDHRLCFPLQVVTHDFMIGGQQKASPAFVCWNNAVRNHFARGRLYNTGRSREDSYHEPRVVEATSWPSDCLFIASAWEFCDLLELRIKIDPKTLDDTSGWGHNSALSLACRFGSIGAAQILIDNGAKTEQRDGHDRTLLTSAIVRGDLKTVGFLLEHGANPNPERNTALHDAAKSGYVDILQLLLEHNINPEITDMADAKPLDYAAANGHEASVKLLLETTSDADDSAKYFWEEVTRVQSEMRYRGEIGLRDSLIKWPKNRPASQYLGLVLWKAVKNKDEACTRLLLASGANPNTVYLRKPVLEVIWNSVKPKFDKEQLNIVKMLVDHGADPNVSVGKWSVGKRSLMASAAFHGDVDLMRLLADAGADLNLDCPHHQSPLHTAVQGGNITAARFLIERNVNLDLSNCKELLRSAVDSKDIDLVRLLADFGADVNPSGHIYESPLRHAISGGSVPIARFLLEKGANFKEIGARSFTGAYGFRPDDHGEAAKMGELLNTYGEKHDIHWASQLQERAPTPIDQTVQGVPQILLSHTAPGTHISTQLASLEMRSYESKDR
jgi:ankyrin repeat protein